MKEPPPEVIRHAQLIHEWATKNGYTHWQIGAVVSTKYCQMLLGNLSKARSLLHRFCIRYAGSEHAKLDKAQADDLIKKIDTLLATK